MPHISVVTPVYKAEGCLDELYKRLVTALEKVTTDFEIVMVEDCGGDRSWEIVKRLAAADPRVKGLQFSPGVGVGKRAVPMACLGEVHQGQRVLRSPSVDLSPALA